MQLLTDDEKIEQFEVDNEKILEAYKTCKEFNSKSKAQKLRICEIIINLGTKLKEHVNE